jgi:electron transport complex protein RnfB
MDQAIIIIVVTVIGLFFGLSIYLANARLPYKAKGMEKIEAINKVLPGTDCSACGYKECFAYAQALADSPELMNRKPCSIVLQSPEAISRLEEALGIKLDTTARKAVIHCGGRSEALFIYHGIESCRAAASLLSGYKRCPYACLGLGDCISICPQKAISTDDDNDIVVIDYQKCNGCGLCVDECTQNLIELVPTTTQIDFRCN